MMGSSDFRTLTELLDLDGFEVVEAAHNWMEKIANYFVSRSTNGRTEGFNRGLRAILWRACGMTNFTHFRLRVLHAFG